MREINRFHRCCVSHLRNHIELHCSYVFKTTLKENSCCQYLHILDLRLSSLGTDVKWILHVNNCQEPFCAGRLHFVHFECYDFQLANYYKYVKTSVELTFHNNMHTLENKPTHLFRDKVLHKVIYAQNTPTLLHVPQNGCPTPRSTGKEVGLANEALLLLHNFPWTSSLLYRIASSAVLTAHDMRLCTSCALHVCIFVCAIA